MSAPSPDNPPHNYRVSPSHRAVGTLDELIVVLLDMACATNLGDRPNYRSVAHDAGLLREESRLLWRAGWTARSHS